LPEAKQTEQISVTLTIIFEAIRKSKSNTNVNITLYTKINPDNLYAHAHFYTVVVDFKTDKNMNSRKFYISPQIFKFGDISQRRYPCLNFG